MHVVFTGNKFMKEQRNIEANVRREYKSRSSSKWNRTSKSSKNDTKKY